MTDETQKFSRDVIWNITSLAVAGACGIALNALIGLVYGEAALGVFNQVFAAYVFFSQIAVLGVHHSVLKGVAGAVVLDEKSEVATAGILVTAVLGAVAGVVFWLVAPLIADLLSSDEVGAGMLYAAPGLFFFALNKVNLACINAERKMRWYAILQGGRLVFMLLGFGVCYLLDATRTTLPIVLSASELAILVLSTWAARSLFRPVAFVRLAQRCREHVAFGARGFMSGVLADLHSRVDVLMLGYFSSDALVGVYSFAAILAEGLFQVLVVLRANYAPICVRLLAAKKLEELERIIHKGRNRTYLAAIPLAAVASLVYAYVAPHILQSSMLIESAPYFAILLAGMALSAGYMPFFQILLHGGRPGAHTWLMVGTVIVNVGCNAVFIPLWGGVGAATATATAFVASVGLLLCLSRRLLSLKM